jgi:hypothetical protein
VPADPFDGGPGLLVVYDLAELLPERAASLRTRDDILLYAHRASPTREFPVAPDLLGMYAAPFEAPEDDPFAEPAPFAEGVIVRSPAPEPATFARWRAAGPDAGPCSTPRERLWAGLL